MLGSFFFQKRAMKKDSKDTINRRSAKKGNRQKQALRQQQKQRGDPQQHRLLVCQSLDINIRKTLLDYTPYLGHSSGELTGHVGEGGGDHQRVTHSVHYPVPNHVVKNRFLFGL
jgi:hypothetical protein